MKREVGKGWGRVEEGLGRLGSLYFKANVRKENINVL